MLSPPGKPRNDNEPILIIVSKAPDKILEIEAWAKTGVSSVDIKTTKENLLHLILI